MFFCDDSGHTLEVEYDSGKVRIVWPSGKMERLTAHEVRQWMTTFKSEFPHLCDQAETSFLFGAFEDAIAKCEAFAN